MQTFIKSCFPVVEKEGDVGKRNEKENIVISNEEREKQNSEALNLLLEKIPGNLQYCF